MWGCGGGGGTGPPSRRPASRQPLGGKVTDPREARRAPSNAEAPPTDVMEIRASASTDPPVAAEPAAARGRGRGGEKREATPPCLAVAPPSFPPPLSLKTPPPFPLHRLREGPRHVTGAPQAGRGAAAAAGASE